MLWKDEQRQGYDDRVDAYRAMPGVATDLDDDPSVMVQEQVARLKWAFSRIDARGQRVLDWGCGTGYNCQYVREKFGAREAAGVDISEPSVEFARRTYPGNRFEVGDLCDPVLDLGHAAWDCVLCCEVFEHVNDTSALMDGMVRHLAPGGTVVLSTPNKMVFSEGFEPSPLNRTHIKEYCLDELHEFLARDFSYVEIVGQRFQSPELRAQRRAVLHRLIRDYKLLGPLYWNPRARRVLRLLRLEPFRPKPAGMGSYTHADFEFVAPTSDDCIWFCAILRR